MRSSLTPSGSKLTRSSRVKLRCLNLNDNQNYWDSFWGVNWSQANVTLMLNQAVACGFNCVKVYYDGVTSGPYGGNGYLYGTGYPATSVLIPRVAWFVQQCRSLNLRIYLGMNQSIDFVGSTTTVTAANIVSQMAYLKFFRELASDILVAVDLCNEMNLGAIGMAAWGLTSVAGGVTNNAAAIRDITSLVQAARTTVPNMPLTASVYMSSTAGVKNSFTTNAWLDLQYTLGLDFHDYHPYWDFDSDGCKPTLSDALSLESRTKFIGRHLIGEYGNQMDDAKYPAGSELLSLNGVGDQCALQNSFGANYFSVTTYYEGTVQASSVYGGSSNTDGYGYGLLTASYANPRPNIVAAVSRWPATT